MKFHHSNKIIIKESSIQGLGVFASEKIDSGETLEKCPFLVFPQNKTEKIPCFSNYTFCWPRGENWTHHALVMGYGSYYNHSETPNAEWTTDENSFIFYTIKPIEEGEEILINYANGSVFN